MLPLSGANNYTLPEEELMLKRRLTLLLAASLLSGAGLATTPNAAAQQQEQTANTSESVRDGNSSQEGEEQAAKTTAKVKRQVAKFGTGPRAKVEVKLRDGKKLNGQIKEITDSQFTIMEKSKGTTTVAYSEVKSIKDRYLPTWMKATGYVALGILAPVLISTVVVLAKGGQ
jgi:hypothetical protein